MTVAFMQAMMRPGAGVKHVRKIPNFTEEVWETYERITGRKRPEMFVQKKDEDD